MKKAKHEVHPYIIASLFYLQANKTTKQFIYMNIHYTTGYVN